MAAMDILHVCIDFNGFKWIYQWFKC